MKHLDLFSGIGGFALAADRVWSGIEHTFVECDPFCQAVLKKHYPNSIIHGDIRTFITDTEREGRERKLRDTEGQHRLRSGSGADEKQDLRPDTNTRSEEPRGVSQASRDSLPEDRQGCFILTGGFPCQPFSVAGRRKGTDDDRYLWPEMFRVIQLYRPTWVIAENVRGLTTWNDGMVLETVCTDLESEGYEVQPFIIPACAVGAPHRRDRVWIVAHTLNHRQGREKRGINETQDSVPQEYRKKGSTTRELERADSYGEAVRPAPNPRQQLRKQGSSKGVEANTSIRTTRTEANQREHKYTWADDWREVALTTCHDGVDDGLSGRVVRLPDGSQISHAKWRKETLKAYGNAIVPAVAEYILRAIKKSDTLPPIS